MTDLEFRTAADAARAAQDYDAETPDLPPDDIDATRSTSETAAGERDVCEQSPADGAATAGGGSLPADALAAPAPSPVRAPVPGEGVTPDVTEATPASVVPADPPAGDDHFLALLDEFMDENDELLRRLADDQSGQGFAAPDAGADHPPTTGECRTPGSTVAAATATRESTEGFADLGAGADLGGPDDPGPVPEPPLPDDLAADIGRNLAQLSMAVGNLADDLRQAGPHAGNYLDTLRHCRHNLDLLIRAAETADA
jgi:hypothetical protein